MIPYQNMRYGDFEFYWGESLIFYKHANAGWIPVMARPINSADIDRDYMLENCGRWFEFMTINPPAGYQYLGKPIQANIRVNVGNLMTLFESDDWVTYEPRLGYFYNPDDKLILVTSQCPRNRYKGLHQRRLTLAPPIDSGVLTGTASTILSNDTSVRENVLDAIAWQVCQRMNTPFSNAWHPIVDMLFNSDYPSVILSDSAAAVKTEDNKAMLIFEGTYLGVISRTKRGALRFTPRTSNTSTVEAVVHTWIRDNLKRRA